MAALHEPVTGPPALSPAPSDGSVPLRLELRDLQQNYPDQWNLYLLGLDAFKKIDEKSDLSYYGIAGIHGRPYRSWGGVGGDNNDGWQGYCTHSSILFAPWHRPYLALFEQAFYGVVQGVASQFPDSTRARYQEAASTFRIPYWDWAAQPLNGDTNFPNSVGNSALVDVITPKSNGQTVQIPNPLYSCEFAPLNPIKGDFSTLNGSPYNEWPQTLRYPSSTRNPRAVSEEDQVFDAVASQVSGLQQNVQILLNDPNYSSFDAFSNHVWQVNEPGTAASLEDIHNSIHGIVGGNMGHMSEIDYAAFDPVFWLHHTNVDRLFAIWQALNPQSYTINKLTSDGTFVITANSIETATTPLAPFYDASGSNFWTSEGVRSTETFNYAYPETQRWAFASDTEYANSVLASVQRLYGGVSNQFMGDEGFNLMAKSTAPPVAPVKTAHGSTNDGTTGPAPSQKPIAEHQAAAPTHAPATGEQHHSGLHPFRDALGKLKGALQGNKHGGDGTRGLDLESEIGKGSDHLPPPEPRSYTEYICNLRAPKHILNQTYRVHVFLGEFTPELKTWHTQDALLGTFVVLGKDQDTTGCGKCKKDADANINITGTVPLTAALIEQFKAGNLGGLTKDNVLPYLTKNLHWRVTLADGSEKDRSEVPGLKVTVVSTEVSLPGAGFPRYSGVYEVHPEVTEGRPAGHNAGEDV